VGTAGLPADLRHRRVSTRLPRDTRAAPLRSLTGEQKEIAFGSQIQCVAAAAIATLERLAEERPNGDRRVPAGPRRGAGPRLEGACGFRRASTWTMPNGPCRTDPGHGPGIGQVLP